MSMILRLSNITVHVLSPNHERLLSVLLIGEACYLAYRSDFHSSAAPNST